MFDNIGGKIKRLAQVICWLGILANIVLGLIIMGSAPDGDKVTVFVGLFEKSDSVRSLRTSESLKTE